MKKMMILMLIITGCNETPIDLVPPPEYTTPVPPGLTNNLIYVNSDGEYKEAVNTNKDRQIVRYFFATWCGPCKTQAPIYESLAAKNKDVVFLKIDIDKCKETTSEFGVGSIPTIIINDERFIGVTSEQELQARIHSL